MSSGTWIPLQRDYELERTLMSLRSTRAVQHPLMQSSKKRGGVVVVKMDTDSARGSAPAGDNDEAKSDDPLSAALQSDDPLSGALSSDDPLSGALSSDDPLSGGVGGGGGLGGAGGGAAHRAAEEKACAEQLAQAELEIPWDMTKKGILAEYSVGTIKVKASFLDDPCDELDGGPVSMDKSKERLRALQGGQPEDTLELSQKDYMDHIQKLHGELKTAWETSEKVLSLKLAIQCAKLLSDVDVPHFYPSMFVLVSDILDTFGTLVFQRIEQRCKEVSGRPLPQGWTSRDVPVEAKETCRNWFYKVACIRELLPRLYLELSLLRCFRFLSDAEYPQVISRLSCMIRGVGDPLVASYARVYMSRSADMVAAMGCQTMPKDDSGAIDSASVRSAEAGRACSKHTLGALYDFMFTFKDFEETKLEHHLTKCGGLDRAQYMRLISPAIEWMVRVIGNGAEKDVFTPVLQHYRGYCANTMMLRHILAFFKPQLWVNNALAVVGLVKDAAPSNFAPCEVLEVFASKCMHCPPPAEQRLAILNDAWSVVRKEEDLPKYTRCCAKWVELLLRHYSDREVLILLRDLTQHLEAGDTDSTDVLRPLEDVVTAIVEHSSDFGTLLTSDHFITIMGLFKADRKADVCKTLLDQFAKRPTPTGDIVLINSVLEMARLLHDSVDSLSEEGERRHVARLLCGFISRIDYGADLEQQLNTYVECRAAFSNLDSVKDRLVLSVARLAVKAHSFMKGRHTRKTSAFVKACLAYCHITIPSIDSFFTRLHLQLLCGEVALLNSCLPQTDTFFKGAISLIPDVPASEEIDYKMVATEPKLVAFIKQFCAALVMVPGHPQHGPFYLVRGLLNAVQRVEWNPASGGRAEVSLAVLGAMCVFAQSKFPYKCVGVDANDTLYGGGADYTKELHTYIDRIMDDTMQQLAALGGEQGNNKHRQVALVLQLLNLVLCAMQLSPGAMQLTGKLLQLVANNKASLLPQDVAYLGNTVAFIRQRAAKAANARTEATQDKAFQKLAKACKKLGL